MPGVFVSTPIRDMGAKTLINYRPKHRVEVGGKMSEIGADKAGIRLANAALVAAVMFGAAAIIAAVGVFVQ